jgi:two-component system, chemotaxis family, protein-glutamate methylesterase/glutaminase
VTISLGVRPLRVLVVDDSAYNRKIISEMLASSQDVEVVGRAMDGEEALAMVASLRPDVITLDLEMPGMGGFAFLRILMSRQPTPVIVISSYAQKENVFKALELGAVDFVAKPERHFSPETPDLRDEILAKVRVARSVRPASIVPRPIQPSIPNGFGPSAAGAVSVPPRNVVAIAASTGGPTALIDIFAGMPPRSTSAILVAQHMPERFTRTFADRLDRKAHIRVSEAQGGELLAAGSGLVCPGGKCMEIEVSAATGDLRVIVSAADKGDRYVPSGNRLFCSAARALGNRAIGVILTGMGDDGVEGARAIRDSGGTVIAESELTAIVHGMPGAAIRAGVVTLTLTLQQIADHIAGLE